jgi:hypothetical protein
VKRHRRFVISLIDYCVLGGLHFYGRIHHFHKKGKCLPLWQICALVSQKQPVLSDYKSTSIFSLFVRNERQRFLDSPWYGDASSDE